MQFDKESKENIENNLISRQTLTVSITEFVY